ncbi:MAG TPA: TonB family protein [Myxococcaceae bacterium]|nr:TonB family protein [Myxococcaceae bacterium]
MAISALLHAVVLIALGAWLLDRTAHRDGRLIRVSLSGPGDDAESHRLPGEMPGLPVPAAVPQAPAGPAVKLPEAAPKQRPHSPGGAHPTRTRRFSASSVPASPTAPAEAPPAPVEATPPPGPEPSERAGAESAASATAPAGEVEPAGDALPRSRGEPGPEEEDPDPTATAQPPTALEGAEERPDPSGDDRLDSARRALASANELLELAASDGGEVEARLAEAATALAIAEEKLRGLEATATSPIGATPQAGPPVDLPAGAGAGSPGAPRLSGDGRLDALAQDRVNYVISLIGPSAVRRAGHGGTGRVAFRVDERGYVRDLEIWSSTGDGLLDEEIEPALHLAEPFAETPEWISVMVHFER